MIAAVQIALVDDSDEDAGAFARAFSQIGETTRWSSGEAFVHAITKDPASLGNVSLLLVDLNLPGIDGVAVAVAVRAAPGGQSVPLVVLTGSHAERDIVRALNAGVTEYEVKPDDIAGLRALVARCAELIATAT